MSELKILMNPSRKAIKFAQCVLQMAEGECYIKECHG